MKESPWTISKESLSFPVRCDWNPTVTVSGDIFMGSYMTHIDQCNQPFLGSLSFLFHSVFQSVLRNSNYCIRNKSDSSSLPVKDFYNPVLWHISFFFFFSCCYSGRVACIPIGSLKCREAEHTYLFSAMYSNLTNATDRKIALCTVILVQMSSLCQQWQGFMPCTALKHQAVFFFFIVEDAVSKRKITALFWHWNILCGQ